MAKDSNQLPCDIHADTDVIPPTTWADRNRDSPIHLSYVAPVLDDHIEYGPLTAQGNFISHHDEWPQDPTLPAEPLGEYDQEVPRHAFPLDADGDQLPPDAWLATSAPPPAGREYGMYKELIHAPYQSSSYTDTSFVEAATPLLDDFTSESVPQQAFSSHHSGIWAFNPMAVDDNFVYPPSVPPAPTAPKKDTPPASPPSLNSAATATTISPVTDLAAHFAATSSMASQAFTASIPLHPSESYSTGTQAQTHGGAHTSHTHSRTAAIIATANATAPAITACKHSTAPSTVSPESVAPIKSAKPDKVKRNKTGQSQVVVPRRQGPLSTAQRQKADDMRYYGACWRCRRYKKPCNGPGTCDTCLTSGFRVWPSTIGCYRGNMEDFIVGVMPGNAEQVINRMDFSFEKVPNWKTLFGYQPDMSPIPFTSQYKDKYEALSVKLQATRMAGQGFVELLDILASYQRSRSKPDTCLELVCSALNHICDIYHAFVQTDTPIRLGASELLNALTRFRTAYSDNWRHFLQLCLSGRRSAWFPAFLCACINVPLLVVLKDGFVAIPEPARTTLWPNISFLIEDLRNRLYPMGLDLLSALAKGIKPWKLRCWGWKERMNEDGSRSMERDPDGIRLLAGDVGAFDGFAAVQAWLAKHRIDMLDGVSFLTTPPFSERNANMQPIAALAWIFEVNPPSDREPAMDSGKLIAGTA